MLGPSIELVENPGELTASAPELIATTADSLDDAGVGEVA
jgi:hypothetical protein